MSSSTAGAVSRACVAAVVLALVWPGAPHLPGAPAPPPASAGRDEKPRAMLERATAELVLIEAYVTDRRDRPIKGLQASDFVLSVDGAVKPIAAVEYREAAGGGAPPAPEAAAAVPAGRSLPRRFVLFFDDETSASSGLALARQAAEKFLAGGLLPDDQIALAAYRKRLEILHDFTTDREALRRILHDGARDPRRVSTFVLESRDRTEELRLLLRSGADSSIRIRQAASLLDSFGALEVRHLRDVLRAVTTLVDSLSAWPGYKAVVFLGDGIPENPAQEHLDRANLVPTPQELVEAIQKHNLSLEINALVQSAAGGGVTMHSVQTAGLAAGTLGETLAHSRRGNSLESLALNTGGVSSSSNDLLKGLVEAEQGSRSYYVISYAPEGPPDGRYHTVRLRVKGGGVRVRWRMGFTRFLPSEAHRRVLQAAHLLPDLYASLQMELSAVPGPEEGTERIADLVVHVPPGRILFLPREGRSTATLEVGLVALDVAGHETLRVARTIHIALDHEAAYPGDLGLNIFTRMRFSPSGQTITAVLSDSATGAVGASRSSFPAAASRPGGVLGLSLYSLAEKSVWVELREKADADAPPEAEPYSVGPALKATFLEGEPLACGFRSRGAREGGAPLRLLIRAGDRTVRELEVPPGRSDHGTATLPLPVDDLAAGDYLLVVQDPDSGGAAELGSLPFSIRPREAGAPRDGPAGR
ncbi:MAG: VWA domain-containing protein [Acidobacteria bacterium]|nr:VWA domain-containing protein [Acidobacteriota bacterium]